MTLTRTRASLFYLAGYLYVGGLGFLLAPALTLELFLSNGSYNDAMVRMVGVLLLSLAILITQMIRLNLDVLYPSTLVVRSLILATLVWLYFRADDPLFLVLTGIVGLGFVLTLSSYRIDRRNLK